MLDTVVISDDDVCCSVVFGPLVSVMWSELQMTSAISYPLWSLFTIYTTDLPPPTAPVQVMAYADDITITSTHTSTSAANKYIQTYLYEVLPGQNITISI